jgi:hypothetical protein
LTRCKARLELTLSHEMSYKILKKPLLDGAGRLGRTEQFTEVAFDTDQPEGQIVLARIIGQAQGKLLAG